MFKYMHHVHYVVENLDAVVEYLDKNFGMKPEKIEVGRSNHPAKEAVYHAGFTEIQVTEPLSATGELAKHMAKHGPGIFHVAWGIEEIDALQKHLVEAGNAMRRPGVDRSPRGYKSIHVEPSTISQGLEFQLVEDSTHKD